MRTLVIGDSIVKRLAARRVQLKGGGQVTWSGFPGGHLHELRGFLSGVLHKRRFPTTIIIHLGTNDIFHVKSAIIRSQVEENLVSLRHMYPNTRLIWSDILPRTFYLHEERPGAGKRATISVNNHAHAVCRRLDNTYFIRHSHVFAPSDHTLYVDVVHLSGKGKDQLLNNWANGLCYFNNNPGEKGFPYRFDFGAQ